MTFGTPAVVESTGMNYPVIVGLDGAKAMVFYHQQILGGSAIAARVATVSGTTVTLGAAKAMSPNRQWYGACAMSSTAVLYAASTTHNGPYSGDISILTVSGTDITLGPATALGSLAHIRLLKLSATTALFLHGGGANVVTVSGTNVTLGPLAGHADNWEMTGAALLDSTRAVAAYREYSSYLGKAVVVTVSGTNVTFGPLFALHAAQTDPGQWTMLQAMWVCPVDSTRVVVCYRDGANSYRGRSKVLTVSGTNITAGAEAVFDSGTVTDINGQLGGAALAAGAVRIAYNDSSNSGIMIDGAVSGTTVSWGAKQTFSSSQVDRAVLTQVADDFNGLVYYVDTTATDDILMTFAAAAAWTAAPSDAAALSDASARGAAPSRSDAVGLSDFFASKVRNPVAIKLGLGLGEGP